MRKILNNGEKTRQRKNKKRKKEKKEAVKAVYKHFLSHACDTTHVAPLNDPLPTPSTPPSATESGTRHNVIRTVEAMLQPTRGDGDRPKHQTWREWDGGWRAHTVERGLCGEGGERGGVESYVTMSTSLVSPNSSSRAACTSPLVATRARTLAASLLSPMSRSCCSWL